MKVRRTISIDKSDLDALKPILDSNGDNLSLAIRHLINEHKMKTDINRKSADQQQIMMLRNLIIENKIAALIPVPLLKWLVKRNPGVPPLGTFRVIMEKYTRLLGIESLTFEDYFKMINIQGDIFGYQITQEIEANPDSRSIRIHFEAQDTDNLKGAVPHYSCMLAHHPLKLKTRKVMESPNLIIVDYEQCGSEEEAFRSVMESFGSANFTFDEIQKNFDFWNNAVRIIKSDHYEDVILSKSIFLKFMKSSEFSNDLSDLISSLHSVSVENGDYLAVISCMEKIFQVKGLIHRIEYQNNEIKIYHKFDDTGVISIVNDTIIKTLEKTGHNFAFKKGDKITILRKT
jgi:hypothetical protein